VKYILNIVQAIAWLFILPFAGLLIAIVNFPSTCASGTKKYVIEPK